MKYLILFFALLVSSCSTTVPVVAKFPSAPAVLMEKCPTLKIIDHDTTVFSELTKTVTENYTTYYECSTKLESWVEWFNAQKKIFESIK